ncbi:Ldh family oxidoreductase [Breoghania sp. L-A4]|nr:Ldh family oxidoreductase [Breoghania sp. L-A4]
MNIFGEETAVAANTIPIAPEAATSFARDLLGRAGLSASDAQIVAEALVLADLRGVDTHGIARLPIYLGRLRDGRVKTAPAMVLDKPTPVAASLDGDNALGFLVGRRAMDEAIAMASEFGIGMVSARNSNHFGMAATYVLQAVEAGHIAFVFTNASRAMPPWGGREPLFGTSPFAAGAPSGKEIPFVLDMSPCVAARGKIRRAERQGLEIPEGWALDATGRPTTDPTAAMKGVVLPIGGPKGSGLAMLMDIMGGVFSGAGFAGGVRDQYKETEPQNVGHFFMAIKPGLFMSDADFRARMDVLVQTVHGAPLADGFDEVLVPGEIEGRLEADRRKSGIPYAERDLALLRATAAEFGARRWRDGASPARPFEILARQRVAKMGRVGPPCHRGGAQSEFFRHPDRCRIGRIDARYDARQGQLCERMRDDRARRLRGEALSPGGSFKTPADLDLGSDGVFRDEKDPAKECGVPYAAEHAPVAQTRGIGSARAFHDKSAMRVFVVPGAKYEPGDQRVAVHCHAGVGVGERARPQNETPGAEGRQGHGFFPGGHATAVSAHTRAMPVTSPRCCQSGAGFRSARSG